jgi:hypothetical protein
MEKIKKLKKNLKTEAGRQFWKSDPEVDALTEDEILRGLPRLGDPVWDMKYEMSTSLLNIPD